MSQLIKLGSHQGTAGVYLHCLVLYSLLVPGTKEIKQYYEIRKKGSVYGILNINENQIPGWKN